MAACHCEPLRAIASRFGLQWRFAHRKGAIRNKQGWQPEPTVPDRWVLWPILSRRFMCTGGDALEIRLEKLLHTSRSIAVYSAIDLTTGDQLVLKLDYEADMNLGVEVSALASLCKRGIKSPSLPVLVSDGCFRAWGVATEHSQFGDVHGLVTKPLGLCIRGMKFHGGVLCKLAFDILLGLYHLHLIGCRHKDVHPRNMILLGGNQFALIDLEFAWCEDEEKISALQLNMFTTTKPSLRRTMLEAESGTLGDFAAYVSRLDRDAWPDFKQWLHRLGKACGLSDARIEDLLAGRVSSAEFGPRPVEVAPKRPVEQPWDNRPVAIWVKFVQQLGAFACGEGAFFPLEGVKAKWTLDGVEVAGRAIGARENLEEVLAWSGHKGTPDDPSVISGRPRMIVGTI
ncbi:hypothetical protein SELMODRAFT_428689 [Selaginella moellendorffii]|uniref:Protein kinase domain-containing protein n=1 Tax=Selaginella moellendorffii TaxID=88036 RepID=D8T3Q5_SELML|nr:hypothetical protein SELMODRAFT_428689 [Selaginella moellendorffii]